MCVCVCHTVESVTLSKQRRDEATTVIAWLQIRSSAALQMEKKQ